MHSSVHSASSHTGSVQITIGSLHVKSTDQPFHRDSCDILTKNNSLLVPNLYNNYSGLMKL